MDCAQACSCHEDSCDPVTGACRLGELVSGALVVRGRGRVLAPLLIRIPYRDQSA